MSTTESGEAALSRLLRASIVVAALAAGALVISQACAADLGNSGGYKDGPVPTFDGRPVWSGFYGAAFLAGEIETVTLADTDIGLGPKGVLGGVRVGYDWATPGGWLLGGFAEGAYADVSADVGGASLKQDLRWGIGARVGKTFGATSYYVPVSYTISHAKADGTDLSKDLHGWRLGAGVEQQLGGGWALFGEGGSTWYGDVGGFGTTVSTQSVDLRVGFSKHF